MPLTAEWRSFGEFDVVLVLNEDGSVREAMTAAPAILNDFLTTMSGLRSWRSDHAIEGEKRRPEPWGALVISRDRDRRDHRDGPGALLDGHPHLVPLPRRRLRHPHRNV